MSKVRIAINGFGRIGRCVLRAVYEYGMDNVEIVAINGPAEITQHIHLLMFDSVHGRFCKNVTSDGDDFIIDGKKIPLIREKDPEKINWSKYNVDIVLECTGKLTSRIEAEKHIKAGAKKVMISAPAKEKDVKTVVFGVNNEILSKDDALISIGSCTTNCLAPIAKVLNDTFGIEKGFMTTIHSYTGDQNNVDGSHKDLRRARACGVSMVPTSTGAAKAIGIVIPEIAGKLDGSAIRVPTPNVSVVDLTVITTKSATAEEINLSMKVASESSLNGVLGYESRELVSVDFNHCKESSIFDSKETKVVGGNFVRVLAWYDNEWAFSVRMLDIAQLWHSL